jgi:lipoate---protein ligase
VSEWRFIIDHNSYADFSVSISPAIEKAVVAGEAPPTVYLCLFDADSITIGVNEDPEQSLDLEFCKRHDIAFRRRLNGGGPIYAGTGSALIVLTLGTAHGRVPDTSAEAFPRILTALAETFVRRYGFPAEYRPLNDIQVEGRKLVPTSLKIENGVMTFRIVVNLKPIDTEMAGRAMPMPPEKVQDKDLKTLTSRFTWLEREAKRDISAAELEAFTLELVEHAFGEIDLNQSRLTASEIAYAEDFRTRYESDQWLFEKSERNRFAGLLQPGDTVGRSRVKALGGMIRATLAVRDGQVLRAIVNGDWHPRPIDGIAWLEDELSGVAAEPAALADCVGAFLDRPDIEFAGIEKSDLAAALEKALVDQKPGP